MQNKMKRRTFVAVCGTVLAGIAVAGWGWLRRRPPVRWIVAVRSGRYPGPVRPLDENDMKKPGKWIG